MIRHKRRNRSPWLWVVLTAIMIAALAVILNETLFRIRKVEVKGLQTISERDVLAQCGLENGIGYFAVREAELEAGVNRNRYLMYLGMEKIFPNRLILHVGERSSRACVTVQNQTYLMDENAFILERADGEEATGYIRVTGLGVRDARVGEMLSFTNAQQNSAYTEIIKEMIVQDALATFTEMNLANPSDISLTSATGYLIGIGGPDEIRAKLLTVRGVLEYMNMYGLEKGSMDATIPGYVTFTPEEKLE